MASVTVYRNEDTHKQTYGGYKEVDKAIDIPAAKAKMIEDIKARIDQIYSADDAWFIKHVDGDDDNDNDYFTVGWKLTVCKQGESELKRILKGYYVGYNGALIGYNGALSLREPLAAGASYKLWQAGFDVKDMKFKMCESLPDEGEEK